MKDAKGHGSEKRGGGGESVTAVATEVEDQLEPEHLQMFARDAGLFADIHRDFKPKLSPPGRENACWYLSHRRATFPEKTALELEIMRFSTAAEVYDRVLEFKRTNR